MSTAQVLLVWFTINIVGGLLASYFKWNTKGEY
jgi:hypothetical protein